MFEAEQKAKEEKIEKRLAKQKQELYNEETLSFSSDGNTTVTDEEAVWVIMMILLFINV